MTPYDTIILAGGEARRMGGIDKPELSVGGVTLLDRAIFAASGSRHTTVVGPPRHLPDHVRRIREDPAGGGPVAGLLAGLTQTDADVVVLLAADLPFVTASVVAALAAVAAAADGALVVDTIGRPQWLLSAWRTKVLRRALAGIPVAGASLHSVFGSLSFVPLLVDQRISTDCDTPADLAFAREVQATASSANATSTLPSRSRIG